MLFREIIAIYCDERMENMNILCGENVESVDVKIGGACSSHGALKVKVTKTQLTFMDSTQASYVICCFFRKSTQEVISQELEHGSVAISVRRAVNSLIL